MKLVMPINDKERISFLILTLLMSFMLIFIVVLLALAFITSDDKFLTCALIMGLSGTAIAVVICASNLSAVSKAKRIPKENYHKEEVSICLMDAKSGLQVIDDEDF